MEIPGLSELHQIGMGGFATVYAARDDDFGRMVAVKVLQSLDEAGRRRFERERLSMGRLDRHPHVVTPYRSGYTAEGRPFVVMEYVDGGSLEDRIRSTGPLGWEEAATTLLPVVDALGYAHQRGVLHRDVKPANILVGQDGAAKLGDFGIAAITEATATQAVAYSLAHAPPETFLGGNDQRTEQSDLYSLASTLFAAVAGHGPFDRTDGADDSQFAYLARIADQPVPSLGLGPSVDDFLARALAKEPAQRPADAAAFAAELQATIAPAGAAASPEAPPVASAPVSTEGTEHRAAIHDHPTVTSDPTRRSRRPEASAATVSDTSGRPAGLTGCLASPALLGGLAAVAALAVAGGVVASSLGDGSDDTAAVAPDTTAVANTVVDAADEPATEAADGWTSIVFADHPDVVWVGRQLPDGSVITGGADDSRPRIWDPDSADQIGTGRAIPRGVFTMDVLPDGRVVSNNENGAAVLWSPDDAFVPAVALPFEGDDVSVVAALNDDRLALGGAEGLIAIVNPDGSAVTFFSHGAAVRGLVGLADGRLVSVGADGEAKVWGQQAAPAATGILFQTYTGHGDSVEAVVALTDGRVATAGADNEVHVWDPDRPEADAIIYTGHTDGVVALAELADGSLASSGWGQRIHLWDPADPEAPPVVLTGHTDSVESLTVLADGRLLSTSADGTARVWSPQG